MFKNTSHLYVKALGQADAGRVILNIERAIAEVDDEKQAETFRNTISQIKTPIANNMFIFELSTCIFYSIF